MQLLGDDTRRSIVELLANGPRAVGDLASALPVTRPAVSQHLAALKRAGLVTDQRAGTRRIYRLDPGGLQLLRTYLDHMWTAALEGFGAVAHDNSPPSDDARSINTPSDSPPEESP